jgi:hypothetical protein
MILFVLKMKVGEEDFEISYESIDACLKDPELQVLFEKGAKAFVQVRGSRFTRDVTSLDELRKQIIANSRNILSVRNNEE